MTNHQFACPTHGKFAIGSGRPCPVQAVCPMCQPPTPTGGYNTKFPILTCAGWCMRPQVPPPFTATASHKVAGSSGSFTRAGKAAAQAASWTTFPLPELEQPLPQSELVSRLNEILEAKYELSDLPKIEADVKALAVAVLSLLQPKSSSVPLNFVGRHVYDSGTQRCLFCLTHKNSLFCREPVPGNTMTEAIYIELPPFFLNQSRWKSYQDCDRLYAWQHVENLEADRKKVYFEIGSAVHAAQVAAHQGGGTQQAFDDAADVAEKVFRKGMGGPKLPGDEELILDGVATVKRLLPAYFQTYGKLGQLWKPLGMELAFCVEVGEGTNVWLVGRIDNLVTFMNGLWLVDYKTMGRLDLRDFLKYEIDVQLTAYIYGGTKQLSQDSIAKGGKPVVIRGAIIDGMVKTIVPKFHRELYTRSVDDLREFELEFCQKAWEIAAKHAIVRSDRKAYDAYCERIYALGTQSGWKTTFPKNTQQCFRYGTCSHRDLCVKDTETRRLAFRKRVPDYVDEAAEKVVKP